MIADWNTMPRMFNECNKLYFNRSLPEPKYGIIHKTSILARFEFYRNKKNTKKTISYQTIKFSDCYDFTEEQFRNLMVHEMIHYYLAWNNIKEFKDHGKKFMAMASEINEKYNLNVTKKIDTSSYVLTEDAPKHTGIMKILFG